MKKIIVHVPLHEDAYFRLNVINLFKFFVNDKQKRSVEQSASMTAKNADCCIGIEDDDEKVTVSFFRGPLHLWTEWKRVEIL